MDSWVRPLILPCQPDLFRGGEIFGFILLAIILLNIYQPRFYCRYLCPLGGLLGLLSSFIWLGVRVKVHSLECIMCMICPTSCPNDELEIKPGNDSPIWGAYDPGRRTALITLGAVAIGAGFLGTGLQPGLRRPHKLRPPGSDEGSLLDRCLRCGECSAVCPINAMQLFLEKRIVPVQDGEDREVLLPIVDRGRCIGCGVCENKCPLSGEAAIRVYVAPITPGLYVVK